MPVIGFLGSDSWVAKMSQAVQYRRDAQARAETLRPHIAAAISRGLISSNAIAADLNARGIATPNGSQWFPMQVRRVRDRLGL
jgi:hypothetical protein